MTGDVSNIIIKDEGGTSAYDWHYDLAFYYTKDGKLWRALWDKWTLDGNDEVDDYETIAAREFYYDANGARYLSRAVDPRTWEATTADQSWTDYQGLLPYQDFSVSLDVGEEECDDCDEPVELRRYLDGVSARQELDSEGDPTATFYMHGDLIGSVNALTDDEGDPINVAGGGVSGSDPSPVVCYTAFGERVVYASSTVTIGVDLPAEFARAGYSGQTGYESAFLKLEGANLNLAPVTLQHLGMRWYRPGLGRFVQRDPIGLRGGLNTYAYCSLEPNSCVDSTGLWTLQVGMGAFGLGGIFGASVEIGIGIDSVGVTPYLEFGGYGGLGLVGGLGGNVTWTSAPNMGALAGLGFAIIICSAGPSGGWVGGRGYLGATFGGGAGVAPPWAPAGGMVGPT